MTCKAQQLVHKFHETFGLPISIAPIKLKKSRVELRAEWMREEIEEFLEANDVVDQLDAIADLIYYAVGVFVEMGIDGDRVFELVHRANMNKLDRDGRPVYDEKGRVTKPYDWISPKESIREWLASLPSTLGTLNE